MGPQQACLAPSFRVVQTMAIVMKQCLIKQLEQLVSMQALNLA